MEILGLEPGPGIRRILEDLLEMQEEGTIRTRDEAMAILEERRSSGPQG